MTLETDIDNYIYEIMMPYMIYLKMILSDKKVYKKLKNSKDEKLNLYFLMEIIKKKIEGLE